MKTQVVSGFSPLGYIEYGKAFMSTFCRYWPDDVDIAVYVEEPCRGPERIEQRSLWECCGVKDFIADHNDPRYQGKVPVPGWRKKDERVGYAWRFDAVRFCRQLFIPEHAIGRLDDGDLLCWLDGDVISYSEVPPGFIASQVHHNDLVTLGRTDSATELGFWAIRVNDATRELLRKIAGLYRTGGIFRLPEWHSGYVFDHVVKEMKLHDRLNHRSLTHGNGHVWFQAEIGRYTDHLKGNERKQQGFSKERDSFVPFQPKPLLSKAEKRPPKAVEDIDSVQYALEHITPRRRLAIDVGASTGDHSVALAKVFDRVFAFEPFGGRFATLESRLAPYSHAHAAHKCVLDGTGLASIVHKQTGRKLNAPYYQIDGDGDIPVTCLDSLGVTKCDLIRVAVGGAELLVLRGARNIIASCHPVIIIERDGQAKRYGIKDWQVGNFLEATLNYECLLENHPESVWGPEGMYRCE